MPELPEVETIKNGIEKAIAKASIKEIIVRQPKLRQIVPVDLPDKVKGAKIIAYKRRAKYLLLVLDNGLTIIWHMGMSGKVQITEKLPEKLNKHDHIIVKTDNGFLIYNDPRRFGLFTYCKSDELQKNTIFKDIGIEPFDKELTASYLCDKLKNKKIPIKAAIMDQKIIVGIGNIYASEALFAAKISPLRPANEVTLAECKKIISAAQSILKKAIEAGGSTLRDYEKPDGSLGYFQNMHCVYNKTGQACPNCTCNIEKTGGIRKINIAGRSTFYCATKQK